MTSQAGSWLLLGAICCGMFAPGCTGGPRAAEEVYRDGVTAMECQDYQGARRAFQQVLQQDPQILEAQLNLAAIDLATGQPIPARQRLEALIAGGMTADPRVRYLHALTLIAVDEEAAGLAALRTLDQEGFPEAAFALGEQLAAAGDLGEAQYYFGRYRGLRPGGGFEGDVTAHLAAMASRLTDMAIPEDPADAPDDETQPVTDPAAEPEPTPAAAPDETPTDQPAPAVTPDDAPSESTPAPTPAPDPAPAPLSKEEKIWRDARFLEIRKKDYKRALETYRAYLQMAPFGEHATGAQEGILRCEAALRDGNRDA